MVNNKEINTVKLGDILSTSFTNGIYKSSNHYGTGVSILRITDFDNDGYLVTDDLQRVELSDAEVSNYKLQPKDIVVNRVNSLTHIGKSILWMDTKNEITVYESNMMRIKPKESVILPEYLIKILHSHPARNHYKRVAKRAIGQSSINQQDVKSLLFFLPPLSEQQKIAKILSTWDKAISTTERLIDNSTQQKKALMQQLLTGKKRFGYKDITYSFQKTRYGDIPLDWEYPAIKDISVQLSKKNTDGKDYPVVSCSKHYGFVDSLDYFKKKVYSDDTSGYRIIPRNAFGFPSNHIEEGSIGLQTVHDIAIASPIYVVFKADPKLINNVYLYALLKTEHYRQIFCAATNASVDRRGSLRWKEFSAIRIPLPPLKEQQQIATVLTNADKEIELLEQQLADLQQEKKALMQVLLTGKKRVVVDGGV